MSCKFDPRTSRSDLHGAYSLILRVENFRRGAMEKLGIGYETLVEANPTIILASVSGTVPVHQCQFLFALC